ncbi:LOW QUALITY PROTEIN: nitric oxide synthase, inducible-like [Hemicordylus capensis]|uniref:LOW QUALITY PROTEIN: nitric oxide synthase, inducible-like n=1 Tax=Hemicordylus capensis TaxID=884348 RepID=UPI002302993A|nr:LOW QUALITY PROTEIN: nitric oxide synthase, inducible-like [Hemicordylus capensis]
MMCQLLFKSQSRKNRSQERKDINNDVEKATADLASSAKQESALPLNGLSKTQDELMHAVPAKEVSLNLHQISRCPRHLQIKNWEHRTSLQDTLHSQGKEVLSCRTKVCRGSLMKPEGLVQAPRDGATPREELLPQAREFINLYYSSFKKPRTIEHLARLGAVHREIETTGTYHLTKEELVFAAKQAWRNAPRCIGRIQGSNLQVFDARNYATAEEMFEHLCQHLKYPTNGGDLRSAITVFPQRTDGKHDFRIWNSQLLQYAGYHMPDGSVVGDPANVEFTQLCIQLGWKPKYGRFDVVPLVLQANGQEPELFELPPDLVLEVPTEHPTYEWFTDPDLKWSTVPAVSKMLPEAGGLELTACPFNGWYMGSEIGVRDFCDTQRYSLLEAVGRRMGLETNKLSSLWKDKALVEVNIAVLRSFRKQNVTILDHHSAAESFMKYMQNEYRPRGGCPADWVWLVPPVSGSITPILPQEMLSCVLSPFCYCQVDAWKTHVWKDERRKPREKEIKFRVWAKAVLFASLLMQRAMALRTQVTVLYASETGKSETRAQDLGSLFNCAFSSKVVCMEDFDLMDLEKESLLLVVTSTFGNGDSPSNGKKFQNALLTMKSLNKKFRFAVFGLGSSTYPEFCAFAHLVYQKLSQLGASPVVPMDEGDELNGQEEAFRLWAVNTFKIACDLFDVRAKQRILLPKAHTCSETWDSKDFRAVCDSQPLDLRKALGVMHGKHVVPMTLKGRENLQSPKSSRATLLIKLSYEANWEVQYLPGAHLGIFPGNQKTLVDGLITRVVDAPPPDEIARLERRSDRKWLLDVDNLGEYNQWKFHHSPTILEVPEEFPSIKISATFLLSRLPLLTPCYYSISSSQDWAPGERHLTVAVVSYRTRDGKGPVHHGVCSSWLNTVCLQETIPCFVRSADGFRLPKDPSKPCTLTGPGTGLAPFRSSWQQRLYGLEKKGNPGLIPHGGTGLLLFGGRHPSLDHLCKEEMQEMERKGVLREVCTAYSQEPTPSQVYGQDLLWNELGAEIHRLLHEEDGHLFVCGDVCMAGEVARTLKEMFARQLDVSEEASQAYFFQLKQQKRYHEDTFGAVFPHENQRDSEELKTDTEPSSLGPQPHLSFSPSFCLRALLFHPRGGSSFAVPPQENRHCLHRWDVQDLGSQLLAFFKHYILFNSIYSSIFLLVYVTILIIILKTLLLGKGCDQTFTCI